MSHDDDDECFMLIPVGDVWATACFSEEFTEPWQWRMEEDHIIPTSRGGTDDPENIHLSHLGCQRRQGGYIGGPTGALRRHEIHGIPFDKFTPEQRTEYSRKGALRRNALYGTPFASFTPEQRSENGRKGTRKGTHTLWHKNRGIFQPSCDLCLGGGQ